MRIPGKPGLAITFEVPNRNEPSDAIVLLAGSGKIDRDGNIPGMPFNIYRLLSDFLIERGFATLRYDKRGVGESKGNYYTTGLSDLLNDVDRVVEYLKEDKRIKKIYLLGHSEGCMLATLYARDHSVDGLILLSGAGIALKTAMLAQNKSVLAEVRGLTGIKGKLLRMMVKEKTITGNQQKLFSRVQKSKDDVIRLQMVRFNAKWMREHFAYNDSDFLEILSGLKIPVFAATGSKDVQADVADLNAVKALSNNAITVKQIEDMDHMLRSVSGKKTMLAIKKQYKADLKKPLSEKLLEELENFLLSSF